MSVQAMARGLGLLFLITRILSARIPPVAFAACFQRQKGAPSKYLPVHWMRQCSITGLHTAPPPPPPPPPPPLPSPSPPPREEEGVGACPRMRRASLKPVMSTSRFCNAQIRERRNKGLLPRWSIVVSCHIHGEGCHIRGKFINEKEGFNRRSRGKRTSQCW